MWEKEKNGWKQRTELRLFSLTVEVKGQSLPTQSSQKTKSVKNGKGKGLCGGRGQ